MSDTPIASFANLPAFTAVLTSSGAPLAINADLQKRIAIIMLSPEEQRNVAILHTVHATKLELMTAKHRIQDADFLVSSTLSVEPLLLQDIYSGHSHKDEDTEDDWKPENQDLFKRFRDWTTAGVRERASDIHIEVREAVARIRFRVDGHLYTHAVMPDPNLALKVISSAYTFLADPSTRSNEMFDLNNERNCMINQEIDGKQWRFRFESYPVTGNLDCTMRIISIDESVEIPSLVALGYTPSQVEDIMIMLLKPGLIVIVGIPGSGKSTSALSMINAIPDADSKKIVSIEDPVEKRLPIMSQISVQRRGGGNANSDEVAFTEAARTMLRADLDVAFIGEIRDRDVGDIATYLTQAGAKGITTVHAGSGLHAIPRLASEKIRIPRQALGDLNFIAGIIYQVLLPVLCDHCKKPAAQVLEPRYLEFIEHEYDVDVSNIHVRGDGCPKCKQRQIHGRIVAAEIIRLDDYMRQCIRDGRDADCRSYWLKHREASFNDPNMRGKTAFEHGFYSVLSGKVDPRDLEKEFEPFSTYAHDKTARGSEHSAGAPIKLVQSA